MKIRKTTQWRGKVKHENILSLRRCKTFTKNIICVEAVKVLWHVKEFLAT
jgi:hypothetical protein